MEITEVVDKSLIERLILEHSDRLELEINQKARADAWKFYYRVRVDHVVRPFAVCKVCFRVLHCDSRSGTASLLRHPCNPLSERSPVNRAVKLNAKLNLPPDAIAKAAEHFKGDSVKTELPSPIDNLGNAALRHSPVSLMGNTTTSNCSSPTSTGSPPTPNTPALVPSINGGRKRKVAVTPANFPLDLRLLHLPHMMAAVAANPLAAINLANATALLSDPQQLQHHIQQQSHLELLLREHQLQQERELKRNREEDASTPLELNGGLSGEASSSSPTWGRPRVKKERADTSEETVVNSCEDVKSAPQMSSRGRHARDDIDDPGGGMNKEMVQHLVSIVSERVQLSEKDSGGSHYISDVWSRFQVIYIDGILRPFAACKNCFKVVTYTKYSGTGGLLRHRCSSQDLRHRESISRAVIEDPPAYSARNSIASGTAHLDLSFRPETNLSSRSASNRSFNFAPTPLQNNISSRSASGDIPMSATAPAMVEVARALLRYMCHDLVSANAVDSPAFHHLVWTVLNLGASHGSLRQEDTSIPSSKQLLQSFLPPLVSDSRETLSRDIQDQNYLCLSLHCQPIGGDTSLMAASIHCVTSQFQLQNHALGTRRFYKSDSREDVVQGLLMEFFHDGLSTSSLREKYVTVVTDEGDVNGLGSTGVKCVWHSIEAVLETLTEVSSYARICDEVRSSLTYLADSGVDAAPPVGNLRSNEPHRWEALLHAITFIMAHYKELRHMAGETAGTANGIPSTVPLPLSDREVYEEVRDFLIGIRRCLMTVRDSKRPTLNQAVLCRAKLLHLCSLPSNTSVTRQVKEFLSSHFETALNIAPLHLIASFLDPRCKSLKVMSEAEKGEVHRLVLDMMKAVSVTEVNSGVLNLKTTRRSSSPNAHKGEGQHSDASSDSHPFSEYMDNPGSELSVSDSEEIIAYVNMKVHLDNDDILSWWAGPSASGLPTLRRLARKVLAVPATCAYSCQVNAHAVSASDKMGIVDQAQLNDVLYMKYNMS